MRIVMYSPDSIGLGHMRRNATIAAELVRQEPTASVALLIGSGAGAFFSVPNGIDTIKLPSVQKVAAETWRARTLNLSAHETTKVRAAIIRDVVASLKPDVLLVDHLPTGVCGDVVPALELIRHRGYPTHVVLGLRDILDEPELICQRWAERGHYDVIDQHYDDILIYGDEAVFPTAKAYELDRLQGPRISYAGYVCSANGSGRQSAGRRPSPATLDGLAAWTPGERIIVATGGGGHDAFPMLDAALAALQRMDGEDGFRAVIISGPLMPDGDRQNLTDRASALRRTVVLPWTSDCMDYLWAADVSLVMAGYNSALEALSTSSRVVMLPRQGPSAEQRMRASLLSARGLVTTVEQRDATPVAVETAIRAALAKGPRAPETKGVAGGANAATHLIDFARTGARPDQIAGIELERSRYVVF